MDLRAARREPGWHEHSRYPEAQIAKGHLKLGSGNSGNKLTCPHFPEDREPGARFGTASPSLFGENMNEREKWEPIPEFPGYEVSNYGRVRSFWIKRQIKFTTQQWTIEPKPTRVLKTTLERGYHQITLCKDGKHYCRKIHKLVLLSFVGPRPKGLESCHNDGERTNNYLYNLRWDTRASNLADIARHKIFRKKRKAARF